jgi:hypothetical protein
MLTILVATQDIGYFFTINGGFAMVFQSYVFPEVSRRLGILRSMKIALLVMFVTYAIMPFTTLIEASWLRQSALFGVWMIKTLCTTFAFPCCTILLTNTASSIRILGTVNGITTSVGALGRAIGPSMVGYTFTWGVKNGYVVAPFWLNAILALCALPPLLWAVEGDGFGDDEDDSDWPSESDGTRDAVGESETHDLSKQMSATGAMRMRRTSLSGRHDSLEVDEEFKDEVVPLSRQTLLPPDSFSAVLTDTEDEGDDQDERASSPFLQPPDQFPGTRLSRGGSKNKPRRRSSTPLGDRVGYKKLSSNLGVSRSGYGSGGEL